MPKWPKFEEYEEFMAAAPAIYDQALRLSKRAWRWGVEAEEVFGRMLVKIGAGWSKIPKGVGQATYLWRIFYSCLFEEIKSVSRSTIELPLDKPGAWQTLERMSDCCRYENLAAHSELHQAIEELDKEYPVHTWILILRGAMEFTWHEVADTVSLCEKTCQNYYKHIKRIFRERYGHLNESALA